LSQGRSLSSSLGSRGSPRFAGAVLPGVRVDPCKLPSFLLVISSLPQVCRPWRRELEARGCCSRTAHLCSALVEGGHVELRQNALDALRRLTASTGFDGKRSLCLDGVAFLDKSVGWKGSLQEWLQAASQEPAASLLSRGAASTAQSLGVALVEWVGKPQGRYPGGDAPTGHATQVISVTFSRDGKRVVSASNDKLVKTWDVETGAEVGILLSQCAMGGEVARVFFAGVFWRDWCGKTDEERVGGRCTCGISNGRPRSRSLATGRASSARVRRTRSSGTPRPMKWSAAFWGAVNVACCQVLFAGVCCRFCAGSGLRGDGGWAGVYAGGSLGRGEVGLFLPGRETRRELDERPRQDLERRDRRRGLLP